MKKMMVSLFALGFMAVSAIAATNQQATVSVKGMMCASCAKKIKTEFMKNEAVQNVKVDPKKGFVNISFKEGKDLTDAQITAMVDTAGKASPTAQTGDFSVDKIERK